MDTLSLHALFCFQKYQFGMVLLCTFCPGVHYNQNRDFLLMFKFFLSCTVWSGSYYSRDLLLISKCVILYSLSCPLQMSKYVFAQSGWLPSVTKEIFFAKVKICMTTLIELKQVPLQYKIEDSIKPPRVVFILCRWPCQTNWKIAPVSVSL